MAKAQSTFHVRIVPEFDFSALREATWRLKLLCADSVHKRSWKVLSDNLSREYRAELNAFSKAISRAEWLASSNIGSL